MRRTVVTLARPGLVFTAFVVALVVMTVGVPARSGRSGTANGEWPVYHGDLAQHHYSPLDQITADNFNDLEVAWRFKTDNLGTRPEYRLVGTPLMVGGVLYATGGTRRSVVALDAATGELLWVHSEREGARGAAAPRQLSGRGLSYWTDGSDERVLYITPGFRLVALDADTGMRIPEFGDDGLVDLKAAAVYGEDQPIDPVTGEIGLHATPTVARDVVIVGSAMREGHTPQTHNNTKGLVQAFDVRTGEPKWIFHTIPRPGEFGHETWEDGSWAVNGNVGVWNQIAADEELGMVYLPVETPTSDFYGGHRPGDNLFAESLVALDLETGERVWHFQLVHHPIWNMDIATAPILEDLTVDGRVIEAVSIMGKQSMVYTFDRATGEPVWPIEELPVPQSDVPGEKTSATQPFPTKPPPYDHQGVTTDGLIDFTPRAPCRRRAAAGPLPHGTDLHPTSGERPGRADHRVPVLGRDELARWGVRPGDASPLHPVVYLHGDRRLAAAPERGVLGYRLRARERPVGCSIHTDVGATPPVPIRRPKLLGQSLAATGASDALPNPQGLPFLKPPYGRLTAIDMNQGENPVAGGARRHTRRDSQPPGATRSRHSPDRSEWCGGGGGDQDAGHHGRATLYNDPGSPARCDAPCIR